MTTLENALPSVPVSVQSHTVWVCVLAVHFALTCQNHVRAKYATSNVLVFRSTNTNVDCHVDANVLRCVLIQI